MFYLSFWSWSSNSPALWNSAVIMTADRHLFVHTIDKAIVLSWTVLGRSSWISCMLSLSAHTDWEVDGQLLNCVAALSGFLLSSTTAVSLWGFEFTHYKDCFFQAPHTFIFSFDKSFWETLVDGIFSRSADGWNAIVDERNIHAVEICALILILILKILSPTLLRCIIFPTRTSVGLLFTHLYYNI